MLGIVIFGLYLGTRPLNIPDEGRYPNVARDMVATGQLITPKVDGVPFLDKPILYYWLEAASMKAFGVNSWAIRLPQALFGLLGCLAIYLFGRKFFNRRTGFLAALLLMVSPLYYFSARYANMDLEVGLWITFSLFAFFNAYQAEQEQKTSSRKKWMLLAFIFSAFGVLTKGLIGFVLPGMVIFCYLLTLSQFKFLTKLNWLGGLFIFFLITLPWYIAVQIQNPGFFHYFFIYQQFDRFTQTGFNNAMPFYFYLGILLAAFLPFSFFSLPQLVKLKTLWKARQQKCLVWFLALWIFLITLFFSIPQSKIVGYILPVAPALALLLAYGFDRYWQKAPKGMQYCQLIFAVIALILSGVLYYAPGHLKNVPHSLFPLFASLGVMWFIAGLATIWLTLKQKQAWVYGLWFVVMAIFSIGAVLAVPHIEKKSHIHLAELAKPFITPKTILVSYNGYYEDLPIYLNHRLIIVYDWANPDIAKSDNWARDLYYGYTHYPATHHILLLPPEFKHFWQTHAEILIFTNQNNVAYLKEHLQPQPKLLAHWQDQVILFKQAGQKIRDPNRKF